MALSEALRVLRPGGVFVLVDRFAAAADYGDTAELAAVLRSTTGLRRESLVATLGVPWPLKTKRAMGPVEVLSGRKLTMRSDASASAPAISSVWPIDVRLGSFPDITARPRHVRFCPTSGH